MGDYNSVDDIIQTQNNRLQLLKETLLLIEDKSHLREQINEAFHVINQIQETLTNGKDLITKQIAITEENKRLQEEAQVLCDQMDYIKDHLPDKFNKLAINDSFVINTADTNGNDSINYELSNSTATPKYKRQIDFSEPPPAPPPKLSIKIEVPYLTQPEFNSIPSYMRGRLTYDSLNAFIDKFNKCANDKYTFLASYKKLATKKRTDIDKYNLYCRNKCQKTEGKRFITVDDLKNSLGGKLDKQTLNMIPMMRHTNRIQENNDGGLKRFIINTEALQQ